MLLKIISQYKKEYDAFIDHPLQTWAWGEARKSLGIAVFRIGIFDEDILTAWYQLSLHKIPYTKFSIGYIPRSHAPKPSHLALLSSFAKEHNIIAITFEPLEEPEPQIISAVFKESFMTLLPQWTQMIDLSKTEEELLQEMDAQARYNIGYAKRKSVYVEEQTNENGFESFWRLYSATEKRQKYLGHTKTHHKTIFSTLHDFSLSRIFLGMYKDTPVCAFETFEWKNTFYYPYGGSDKEFQKLKGQNLGIWEIILFAKKSGFKFFDLWGSLGPGYNKTHPWAGFTSFKQTFGTYFHSYGKTYDFIVHPYLYFIYKILFFIRKYIFKIYFLLQR